MNSLTDLMKHILYSVIILLVYFFLLGTSFDLMTKANTLSNLLGFVGLVLLISIGILFLYNVTKQWVGKSEYETIKDKEWKEHIMKQMEEMQKTHKEYTEDKKKANPKQFDGVKSDEPFVKTRKKTNKTK